MIYLDDYRDAIVVPNYDRPHMTKEEERKSRRELSKMNIVYSTFLFAIGSIFASVAYATGDYVLFTAGVVWILVYYILALCISAKRPARDGAIYLLVDKMMTTDEDIGLAQCIFILYHQETDAYCKIETDYHIYRDMAVGDWIYMYTTQDDVYIIPEYPNVKWQERRCVHETNT